MKWFFRVFDSEVTEEIIYLSNLKKKDMFTKKIEGITLKMWISIESDGDDDIDSNSVKILKILSIPLPYKKIA